MFIFDIGPASALHICLTFNTYIWTNDAYRMWYALKHTHTERKTSSWCVCVPAQHEMCHKYIRMTWVYYLYAAGPPRPSIRWAYTSLIYTHTHAFMSLFFFIYFLCVVFAFSIFIFFPPPSVCVFFFIIWVK